MSGRLVIFFRRCFTVRTYSKYPDWVEERFGDDIPAWAEERWGDEDDDDD